jgi:hypothetical protein
MITPMYISAVAAFLGSAAGMIATATSNWITQHRKHRVLGKTRAHTHRHKLYKQFISEASKLYADALVSDKSEISNLANIYALIARMRVVSNDEVIQEAEKTGRRILDTYLSPNRKFIELPNLMDELDPLRDFSDACRRELQAL